MHDPIIEKVKETVAAYAETDPDQLTLDTSFEALAIDSLDGLSLIAELEEAFHVEIPNDEAFRIRTIREAVESLQRHVSGGTTRPGETR